MASVAHIIRRRRAREARQQQRRQSRRAMSIILGLAVGLLVLLPGGGSFAVGLTYYTQLTVDTPSPQGSVILDPVQGISQLVDRTGQTLLWVVDDPLGDEREWLSIEELPPYVVQATLLREDPDFLQTARFEPIETAQLLFYNHFQGPLETPEPSLTGRLVRNLMEAAPEQVTIAYRAREYALVAELNRRHTPTELLEWHLNTNYYGSNAYGIDAAAQVYFGKRATELTLDEAAMLTAIPTAPQYNPIDDEVAARGRQAEVLRDLMLNNAITEDAFANAINTVTPLNIERGQQPLIAPDYAFYARRQAESILNNLGYDGSRLVTRGGLTITTALDLELYQQAECVLQTHLAQLNGLPASTPPCPAIAYLQQVSPVLGATPDDGVIVLIDVRTGELLAALGDMTDNGKQPGPVLFPFVYLEAFSGGLTTPARMVLDVPLRFPGAADGLIYMPANPDGAFRGPMNLRQAMGAGLLPPVAQVASTEGLDNVAVTARQIGMSSLDLPPFDLSALERGGGVSVLDATYTYSVFAGLGQMRGVTAEPFTGTRPRDPVAVLRIEDANGDVLWAYDETERQLGVTPIMDAGLSYLVSDILADRTTRTNTLGADNILNATRPMATVFGTAGNAHNWTIGYSPNLAVGVWLGREDDAPIALAPYGLEGASTLWRALTEYAHDRYSLPADDWQPPENVVESRVCERSGLRPNDACPQYAELFLQGTIPQDVDSYWETISVNSENGLLATANTPASLREERVFFIPPPDAMTWWEANQLPLPPTDFDTLTRPELAQTTLILRPELLDYVGGTVDIRGSMDTENLQYYQISYGEGLNPSEWIAISDQLTEYTPGASLGIWDTSGLDGLYNLRLSAVMNDNTIDPYIIQVTVDNTPPTIELTAGQPGEVFTFLNNDVIPLVANVQDNVAIDYVEFYHNGVFVGVDEEFPFGYDHPIERVGRDIFSAVVFDAAGNQANSEIEVEVLRGGT